MNMQERKDISPYRQRLKTQIVETAMKAFAEKGIRGVRMDEVASSLGISKRTLYEIYDTKEALLYEGSSNTRFVVRKRSMLRRNSART